MSKEITTNGLTDMQAAFAKHVVDGLTFQQAAEMAGYAVPRDAGHKVSALPHVQKAIQEGMRRALAEDAALARGFLRRVVMGELGGGIRERVDAAKTLMDRAGYGALRGGEGQEKGQIALAEMSTDQLADFVRQAQRALSDRATPIIDATPDNAPVGAQNGAEMADLLG